MSEFNNPATKTATTTYDISYAELAGANRGQRPDLVSKEQGIFRTPDGVLYSSQKGQLLAADNLVPTLKTDPLTGVKGFVVDGISQPPSSPITTPVGFRGTTLATEMDLRRTLMGVVTNFDITSKIPAITNTWYVDSVNGNDGTAIVNTRANPLLNLATALAKAEASAFKVQIINMTADFVGLGSKSWNNVQPSKSVSVVVEGSYRYISCQCAALPTWAVNGTYSNVYSTVIAAISAAGVSDTSVSTTQMYINIAGFPIFLTNQPKRFKTLVKVASLAAVAATAGTFFHDGTSLHVRAYDGRNLVGDTKMIPTTTTQNGRFPQNLNGAIVYTENIDFVGGNSAFFVGPGAKVTATGGASGAAVINTASTPSSLYVGMTVQGTGVPAGSTVLSFVANTSVTISANLTATASGDYNFFWQGLVFAHNNCSFQGANTANGLTVATYCKTYGYRSATYDNYLDGFNYHSFESDGTTQNTSPDWVEIECVAAGNGTTGSAGSSDNATTSHDYCNGIRLNGAYLDSSDRVLVETNFAHSWNLGCYVGQATTVAAGQQSLCALLTSKMWVDSCYIPSGSNTRLLSAQTATMRLFNSGTAANDVTGEGTGTLNSYYG